MIQLNQPLPESLARRLRLQNRGGQLAFALAQSVQPVINWDPERDDTSEFYAFQSFGVTPAVAAQLPFVQVINPLGSGKVVFIDAFQAWKQTAGQVELYQHSAPITSLLRNVTFTRPMRDATTGFLSPTFGMTQIRSQTAAGIIVAANLVLMHHQGAFNLQAPTVFPAPVRLDEGLGLHWIGVIVNESLHVNVYGREYPRELAPA